MGLWNCLITNCLITTWQVNKWKTGVVFNRSQSREFQFLLVVIINYYSNWTEWSTMQGVITH